MKYRKTRVRKATRKVRRQTRKKVQGGGMRINEIPDDHFPMLLVEDNDGFKYHSVMRQGRDHYGYFCNHGNDTFRTKMGPIYLSQKAKNIGQVRQWCR